MNLKRDEPKAIAIEEELYRCMVTARAIDKLEERAVDHGQAFFHVSSAGHDSVAALGVQLKSSDWIHSHYRDKSLLLARGVEPVQFFYSLYTKRDSQSSGRQMSALVCAPELGIASMPGPVGNAALHAVGMAQSLKIQEDETKSIVVCLCGDGTTQQGEYLEALAEAARSNCPVLFVIEDNGWAISTPTKSSTFFHLPDTYEMFGLPITRIDGLDVWRAHGEFQNVVDRVRSEQTSQIVVLTVERLSSHSNADSQEKYRTAEELNAINARDPLARFERTLVDDFGWTTERIISFRQACEQEVAVADEKAFRGPSPCEVLSTDSYGSPEQTTQGGTDSTFATEFIATQSPREVEDKTLRDAIRAALEFQLESNSNVSLLGQDIEDPKGDVFGVTRGLSTKYPGRVQNAPLSESTILGVSIGKALLGERPVAMIQFADFLPLAFNQIVNELATISWRTNGQMNCPVLILAPCGGYRPGLGPFHASSFESVFSHVPGLNVCIPSSGVDAYRMIDAAIRTDSPTILLYPKARLSEERGRYQADVSRDNSTAKQISEGCDITLVGWGNTVRLCQRAAEFLETAHRTADVYDLRIISPWDEQAIIESCNKTGHLIVVHEENKTNGFAAEVIATVVENCTVPVKVKRIARPDTFVPCDFQMQLATLPSFRSVVNGAAAMLGIKVAWDPAPCPMSGHAFVNAIGSAPSDETVVVVAKQFSVGDEITEGQVLLTIEASKSVFELNAPFSGVVTRDFSVENEIFTVGTPLLEVKPANEARMQSPIVEQSGIPRVVDNPTQTSFEREGQNNNCSQTHEKVDKTSVNDTAKIYLTRSTCVFGGRVVQTEELARPFVDLSAEEAINKTGIISRPWADLDGGETLSSLARSAVRQLIEDHKSLPPVAAVICSSTFPFGSSPTISCQMIDELKTDDRMSGIYAYDFNAACSGFLYGLRLAQNELLQLDNNQNYSVLLVTAEVLSPFLDPKDMATAFLFGDAATATLVTKFPIESAGLEFSRPVCKSVPDVNRALLGPTLQSDSSFIKMDGLAVARQANKEMAAALRMAVEQEGISVEDLSRLIPHPGSKRILQSVARRLNYDSSQVLHTLAKTGNTSSCSIPISLDHFWDEIPANELFGTFAFGAGYTAAAAIGRKFDKKASIKRDNFD